MKRQSTLLCILVAFVALFSGCANKAAESYAEHSFEFRDELILDNLNLSELARENHLYLLGAALGVPADEVDAWVAAVLAGEEE